MNLTLNDLRSIPHIDASGIEQLDLTKNLRDVSTDTRTTRIDELYFAIRGENFNGHNFLEQAAAKGGYAAIVDEKFAKTQKGKSAPLPIFVVKDTVEALGNLANLYRKKFDIPVIVIAGSNGKTTTKEMIASVLSTAMSVLKTEANYNNHIGLPKMLFQIREGHGAAVLEIGTNHPGEIEWLCKVAEPTHALVTNVGREHLEFFKDLKGVAAEEVQAFTITNALGGTAFVNVDDKYLKPVAKEFPEDRLSTYGIADADVVGKAIGYSKDDRLEIRVGTHGKSFRLRTYLIADYAPNMIAGAVAVGIALHVRRADIKTAIERFRPHDKRLEVWNSPEGHTIMNDAYNANPDSMEAAFRTLKLFPAGGKKYVVLGDMFELGETAAHEHRLIGKKAAEFDFDHVFFIGSNMKLAEKSFLTASKSQKKPRGSFYSSKADIASALKKLLQPGDAVLVKGSRGMKMEEVVDLLQRP